MSQSFPSFFQSSGIDRNFNLRSIVFNLEKTFSIGFKSGLYGGRYTAFAPTDSIADFMSAILCELKLSNTTIALVGKITAKQ